MRDLGPKKERSTRNLYIKRTKKLKTQNQSASNRRKAEKESKSEMATIDESPSAKRWLPLEANPEVMNQVLLNFFLLLPSFTYQVLFHTVIYCYSFVLIP